MICPDAPEGYRGDDICKGRYWPANTKNMTKGSLGGQLFLRDRSSALSIHGNHKTYYY